MKYVCASISWFMSLKWELLISLYQEGRLRGQWRWIWGKYRDRCADEKVKQSLLNFFFSLNKKKIKRKYPLAHEYPCWNWQSSAMIITGSSLPLHCLSPFMPVIITAPCFPKDCVLPVVQTQTSILSSLGMWKPVNAFVKMLVCKYRPPEPAVPWSR